MKRSTRSTKPRSDYRAQARRRDILFKVVLFLIVSSTVFFGVKAMNTYEYEVLTPPNSSATYMENEDGTPQENRKSVPQYTDLRLTA